MSDTRAPRPTDLVALITFDEEVRENQAVTRDRVGHHGDAPRPLAAAIEQWLHLGRRTWITVAGREIRGIATARDLSARHAWEIDTLFDAPGSDESVILDLLRQAGQAAHEALATHLVLRAPAGSTAAAEAPRAAFRPVVAERLWSGAIDRPTSAEATVIVRGAEDADLMGRFQLYCRAMPGAAREAMAMTVEEWQATQEARWLDRSGETLVAERQGRIVGAVRIARTGQFSLSVDPDAPAAGDRLLDVLREHHAAPFGLVPRGTAAEDAVRRAGLVSGDEFALFCLRISQPVREEAFARAGVVIPG